MPFTPPIAGQNITPDILDANTADGIIAIDLATTGDIYLVDGGSTTWANYLATNPATNITFQLTGTYNGTFNVGLDLAGTIPNLTGVPVVFDVAAGTMAPNVTLTYSGTSMGAVTVNIGDGAQINSDLQDLSAQNDAINIGDGATLTEANALDTGDGNDNIIIAANGTLDVDGPLNLNDGNDSIRVNPGGTLDVDGPIDFGNGDDTLNAAGDRTDPVNIIANGDLSLGDGADRVSLSEGGNVTGVTGDIYLGDGNDQLTSNFRSGIRAGQTIFGGEGKDTISIARHGVIADGGIGDDVLRGQANNQVLLGGGGNDNIRDTGGVSSRDTLDGGSGNDTLSAGRGDDTLEGGLDDDMLTGGDGNDIFIYASGDGADVITDFDDGAFGDGDSSNNDFLDLSAFYNSSTHAAYNNAPGSTTDFVKAQDMLRADLAHDGIANGIFSTGDFQAELGFAPGDGIEIQGSDFSTATDAELKDAFNVLCFSGDTRIETPEGTKAAHDLIKGDLVWTLDRGYQPIMWTHSRTLTADQLNQHPNLDPILIQAGALGEDMPSHDLIVSPQHRLLMRNIIVERMFGEEEVLAAAVHLLSLPGFVQFRPESGVTYVHILLENHEIIMANGALAETLFMGEETGKILDAELEHKHLFPVKELQHANLKNRVSARILAPGRKARKLAMRLEKKSAEVCSKLPHHRTTNPGKSTTKRLRKMK